MLPSARISATIELINQLLVSWQSPRRIPADKLIEQYMKARRYIGSKDRQNIGERYYWIIRHIASLGWWIHRVSWTQSKLPNFHLEIALTPDKALMLTLTALLFRKECTLHELPKIFGGDQYAPRMLTDSEWQMACKLAPESIDHKDMPDWVRFNYPAWLEEQLNDAFGATMPDEMRALQEQAPVDLRVNTLKITREELMDALAKEGFEPEIGTLSATCIRLRKRGAIFASPLFKQGYFEMQDEGSQMLATLLKAEPGMRVIDFCAGAGGKTLAIAADMKNKGKILAWDTSEKRLRQMPERLRRAGVDNVETHVISSENDQFIKRHKGTADRVLVDAPCSGSGTWRRNPDLKWRFTPQDLEEILRVQKTILESALRLVKPGGRVIYATCSLLKNENEKQIEQVLIQRSNFRVVCAEKIWNNNAASPPEGKPNYLWLTPHQDGTDGFFAAVLECIAA